MLAQRGLDNETPSSPADLSVLGARPVLAGAAGARHGRLPSRRQIVAKFAELGSEPLGGTPERARAFIKLEQDKWGQIIREVAIKLN
jgi:hypothetical protein